MLSIISYVQCGIIHLTIAIVKSNGLYVRGTYCIATGIETLNVDRFVLFQQPIFNEVFSFTAVRVYVTIYMYHKI